MTILNRIDATLNNRCPCGADPRSGSAYCSYDCEPTHIAADTDPRQTGAYATPMRWRPDLVNDSDNTNMTRIGLPGDRLGYTGPHNASVYEYSDRRPVWHLRLDNGHRYVGVDVDTEELGPDGIIPVEMVARIRAAWVRLEREVDNTRHLEPDAAALRDERIRREHAAAIAGLDRWVADHLAADVQSTNQWANLYRYQPVIQPPSTDPRSLFRNINVC